MKQIVAFCSCAIICSAAIAQRVSIPNSETKFITSSIVHQQYELQILLPAGYNKSDKKYPVMYLMDSQWDFPLAAAVYGQQFYDKFIPEMIFVGITWAGPNANPDSLRARDYTPTTESRLPQSGGAANYLSFMEKELIPYVENHYRAAGQPRGLMGSSLGGLFTLYALFTKPNLFQKYIAASPAVGWDKEVIYKYEQDYFQQHPTAPAKLYMVVGGVENTVPFSKMAEQLAGRHYSQLQMETRILDHIGHSGSKGEGFARGLQFVFAKQ